VEGNSRWFGRSTLWRRDWSFLAKERLTLRDELLLRAKILIVDDDRDNVSLLEHILDFAGYRHYRSTTDARQALPLAAEFEPDLIILDLIMPHVNGFEIMRGIDDMIQDKIYLPVLVITGDYSTQVKQKALATGAKDFLTRPFDAIEITLRIRNLLEARFFHQQLQTQNYLLEERVRERTQELEASQLELKESQIEIIERLARAAELHDDGTAQHTQRVSLTAALLALSLELPYDQVELIRRASPLHDVGKIGVADPILMKPYSHSESELEIMRSHCMIGAEVLAGGHSELVKMAESIALHHHERWDGSGYPRGLQGEEIPLEARIISVADVFDALTHERPYKPAWPIPDAVAEIERLSGRQFDPQVVEAFLTLPHEDLV
jgi:putative two-component system response regulator